MSRTQLPQLRHARSHPLPLPPRPRTGKSRWRGTAEHLNAINTGRQTYPLFPTDLQQGAHQLTSHPELLTKWLGQAADAVQSRTGGDPYRNLVALRSVLAHLASHVAADLFKTEMAPLLVQLTPSLRDRFLRAIHVCYSHFVV